MKEKILFLGGTLFQLPPIFYAKDKGYEVITCDYSPDNPGHQYADRYYNASTTDKSAILEIAKKEKINGIVAYASDPAAATQAYVANELGLASNPYESVVTLSEKDKFRSFLQRNDFTVPKHASFKSLGEAQDYLAEIKLPAMVKPVDSSGSKGVSKIEDATELPRSFEYALSFSRTKRVIIEEFFEREGYQVAGDGFVQGGRLAFHCFANEHFNAGVNPFVPIGESFPSVLTEEREQIAQNETNRLLDLLDMKVGALNFDFHFNKEGEFSFIELGPRNGGNLIPEVIKYSTGVDLIAATVECALGQEFKEFEQQTATKPFASYIIHSSDNGVLDGINYNEDIKDNIVSETYFLTKGQQVSRFEGSNHSIGAAVLQFSDESEMLEKMGRMQDLIEVRLS